MRDGLVHAISAHIATSWDDYDRVKPIVLATLKALDALPDYSVTLTPTIPPGGRDTAKEGYGKS